MADQRDDWTDPPEIWLGPWCSGCDSAHHNFDEGRSWCEEKSAFEKCDECGRGPVRYVIVPDDAEPRR